MRKNKLLVYILTGLLVLFIWFVGSKESGWERPIRATVSWNGQTEELLYWNTYTGAAYFFIPAYAQLEQVQLHVADESYFSIGGEPVRDGMTCDAFSLNVAYPLTVKENMGILSEYRAKSIMFVKSGDVSTLFLDLSSGNADYLHEDKNHSESAILRLYDADGRLLYTGKADSVSGRGQSSWREDKKSYNIRLMESADLLGLGSAEKWVLQANALDLTHLKNKMVYDCAAEAGLPYSPDSQWLDLYINGEYAGLYLLVERNEVHPERVDISAKGSFLVNKDMEWRFDRQGDSYIKTQSNAALAIVYADMDPVQLQAVWQSVENAILAEDGMDPVSGKSWQELIDVESWVKKYLVEELFGNTDGGVRSQFYYMDASLGDGKVYAGPVWDYDLILNCEPNEFCVDVEGIYGSPWQSALCRKAEFMALVKEQYSAVFRPLFQELVDYRITQYAESISRAAQMNSLRWGGESQGRLIRALRTSMHERIAFFDSLWLEEKQYVRLWAAGYDGDVRVYMLEPGSRMPQLPDYPPEEGVIFHGWYEETSGAPVDWTKPVWQDMRVRLRYEVTGDQR